MKFSCNCLGLKHDKNQKDVSYICCCFKKLIKLELKVEPAAHVRCFNKLPGGIERSSFSLEFDTEPV
jgi:hypothetical protein